MDKLPKALGTLPEALASVELYIVLFPTYTAKNEVAPLETRFFRWRGGMKKVYTYFVYVLPFETITTTIHQTS